MAIRKACTCVLLLLCCGCVKQRSFQKNSVQNTALQNTALQNTALQNAVASVVDLPIEDPLLHNVSIPFGARIEREHASYYKKNTSVFQLHIPPKEIVYLEEYFVHTMEQKGWLLERSFATRDFLLIDFSSITRSCLVIIHRQKSNSSAAREITLCLSSRLE